MSNQPTNILFCGMPKSGPGVRVYEAAIAHWQPVVNDGTSGFKKLIRSSVQSSLLTNGFNRLWCGALSIRKLESITHFCMIHDDVACGPGWADVLLQEMDKYDADIMSVIIPIKDSRGLTSTGIDGEDEYSPRRLTIKECFDREETFTEDKIVVNTGLWICRMDRDWCDKVIFRQTDQILVTADGHYIPRCMSEDWDFSRQVRKLGGRIYATRRIPVYHERPDFHTKHSCLLYTSDAADE